MKRILVIVATLLALAGVSVAHPLASSASVCQPDGTGCAKAGTYAGPNALISSNYTGFQVVWTSSVVPAYSAIPSPWTVYMTYTNVTPSTLSLGCPGDWTNPAFVWEEMSGGSGNDGGVAAASTTCSQNPSLNVAVPAGGTYTLSATFGNVPWPGSTVAIQWGDAGTSASVDPFASPACPIDGTGVFCTPWSGYVHTGPSYSVGGTFVVPHLKCPAGGNPAANPWVGLGGATADSPLVQVGIISRCVLPGVQVNYLVWQMIPPQSGIQIVPRFAFAGDRIFATVDYQGGTNFSLSATDTNSLFGWHWSKTVQQSAEKGVPQTAEWIVEAGGPPLANFGTINFQGSYYRANSPGSIQYVDNAHAVMYVAGTKNPLTSVSPITTTPSPGSFSVSYLRSS
jgi:hypothetical protein